MTTFFISDTHFNHANIIRLSDRPFSSIPHMNDMLVQNWNEIVQPEDVVYHLGDFAMGDKSLIPGVFARLNGTKHLILGNHDMRHNGREILKQIVEVPWASMQNELYMNIDGVNLYMRHVPDMEFKPSPQADFHLCGHVHNSWTRQGPIINVGVDVNGFKPVTLQQLIAMPEVVGKGHRGY